MDFFNSLTPDLKLLAVGIAGCAVLALFSSNPKAEKAYLLVLAVLTAAGIYRFSHRADNEKELSAAASAPPHFRMAAPKHVPLESTSAK